MLQTLMLKRDMIHTWKIMKVTVSGKPVQTSLELWFRPLDLRGPWKVYSYPKKSLWCSNGNHKRPLSQGLELNCTRTLPSSCRYVFVERYIVTTFYHQDHPNSMETPTYIYIYVCLSFFSLRNRSFGWFPTQHLAFGVFCSHVFFASEVLRLDLFLGPGVCHHADHLPQLRLGPGLQPPGFALSSRAGRPLGPMAATQLLRLGHGLLLHHCGALAAQVAFLTEIWCAKLPLFWCSKWKTRAPCDRSLRLYCWAGLIDDGKSRSQWFSGVDGQNKCSFGSERPNLVDFWWNIGCVKSQHRKCPSTWPSSSHNARKGVRGKCFKKVVCTKWISLKSIHSSSMVHPYWIYVYTVYIYIYILLIKLHLPIFPPQVSTQAMPLSVCDVLHRWGLLRLHRTGFGRCPKKMWPRRWTLRMRRIVKDSNWEFVCGAISGDDCSINMFYWNLASGTEILICCFVQRWIWESNPLASTINSVILKPCFYCARLKFKGWLAFDVDLAHFLPKVWLNSITSIVFLVVSSFCPWFLVMSNPAKSACNDRNLSKKKQKTSNFQMLIQTLSLKRYFFLTFPLEKMFGERRPRERIAGHRSLVRHHPRWGRQDHKGVTFGRYSIVISYSML